MGVLTDFVVASVTEAGRIGDSPNPAAAFRGLDAKGIDQIKLGKLYAILSNTEYDIGFMTSAASYLYEGSEDGPWVQLVPQELVIALSETPDAQISAVAAQWAKIQEFEAKYTKMTAADVEAMLRSLILLAHEAVVGGKSLLMWTSL